MTHTTGPWRPQTSPHHEGLWETIDKRNGHLGQSFYNLDNATTWCAEQNERALLEAAPDLLAALQRIAELDTATRQNYNGDPEMHSIPGPFARIARAAIARATGGEA